MSGDDTTLTGVRQRWDRPMGSPADVLALTVVWCGHEPQRVGEVVLVDTFGPGTLGRGAGQGSGRLKFRRIRPGSLQEMGPIESPSLSRNQIQVALERDGLRIRNEGRCRLLVDRTPQDETVMRPGQLIEIEDELVLCCVSRPPFLEKGPDCGSGSFGLPDTYGFVGESAVAWDIRQRANRVSQGDAHVVIFGPSGSGKELVAASIHGQSKSRGRELVSRNAATIPEGLADAELFGNIRDYPNAGMPERNGLIGASHGSTLFLDEIGDLPERLQVHLLRVLDQGEYQRLGDSLVRRSDFRLIAATNRPAESLKEDLLARFRVRFTLAGLEERREDIPLLVYHLLRNFRREQPDVSRFFDGEWPRVSPKLMGDLVRHNYRTHVRELDQILWACVEGSRGTFVESVDGCGLGEEPSDTGAPRLTGQDALDKRMIMEALEKHHGVRSKVWQDLGLRNRHQLARLMKKFGISTES